VSGELVTVASLKGGRCVQGRVPGYVPGRIYPGEKKEPLGYVSDHIGLRAPAVPDT
jgi:hypothetical protein